MQVPQLVGHSQTLAPKDYRARDEPQNIRVTHCKAKAIKDQGAGDKGWTYNLEIMWKPTMSVTSHYASSQSKFQ